MQKSQRIDSVVLREKFDNEVGQFIDWLTQFLAVNQIEYAYPNYEPFEDSGSEMGLKLLTEFRNGILPDIDQLKAYLDEKKDFRLIKEVEKLFDNDCYAIWVRAHMTSGRVQQVSRFRHKEKEDGN